MTLERTATCYIVGTKQGHATNIGVMFFTKPEADKYAEEANRKYKQNYEVIPKGIHKEKK